MPDRVVPGPVGNAASIREAVSIHTSKIFDCCRDKDCVDELRVYPTLTSQTYLDNAISIRPKAAELLFTNVNVEPVSFNRPRHGRDLPRRRAVPGPCGLRQAGDALRQRGQRENLYFRE